jgi:Ca2+-binding RTX toxin-like protein
MAGYASYDRDDPHREVVVASRNDRDGHFAYCGGERATYQGTPRSDGLGWTFGAIVTFGGNDRIFGAGGSVCAGPGDDLVKNRISFGAGEPIYLGPGDDRSIDTDGHIFGGPGNDVLVAGEAGERDMLVGGPGNDRLVAGDKGEREVLRGGPGNDVLIGGPEDVLIGGPGHDRIIRRPAPPEGRDG